MRGVLFIIIFLIAPSVVRAEFVLPDQPDGYVTDRSELLSSAVKQSLEQTLTAFEQQTSTQIVVAIFPSLDGESLEDVSIRLAEQWRIGQRGQDNGVILLIFPNDRKLRIETGYGLEGVLTDAVSSQIINTVIGPRFRAGDFDGGVQAGVMAIMQVVRGEFTGARPATPSNGSLLPILLTVLIILLIVAIIDSVRYLVYYSTHRRYEGRFGTVAWWLRFAWLLFLLNILFRVILHAMLSGRGGYYGSRSGFGGGSSGGFSGGGGGSFGGGGSSGGW